MSTTDRGNSKDIQPGVILFESAVFSVAPDVSQTVTAVTGGLTLLKGEEYAVILDAFSAFDGGTGRAQVDGGTDNFDLDGQFFFLNVNDGLREEHFAADWDDTAGTLDLGLRLDYGDTLTSQSVPVTIEAADLLSNDSDVDGDDLFIFETSPISALGATVSLRDDGSILYDPSTSTAIGQLNSGENAADSFTYLLSDGNGGFDPGLVTLVVSGDNDLLV